MLAWTKLHKRSENVCQTVTFDPMLRGYRRIERRRRIVPLYSGGAK